MTTSLNPDSSIFKSLTAGSLSEA